MKTNKLPKLLVLSVLGVFALTACDEIVAKPSKYEDPLITTPSSFEEEVYNNIASVVYDSIHESGIGSDVLNEILYLYAVNAFGAYNGNVVVNNAKVGENVVTLSQFAKEGYDAEKMNQFVREHKVYWDSNRTDSNADASDTEKKRVEAKAKTIEDRIAEQMYEKISSGTYTDRHEFYEERFLKSLRGSLESVANPDDVTPYGPTQILPAVEPTEVFDEDKGYLHRDFYDSDSNSYVVDEIVPGIYRQLLAEQYLLDETYNTLGRSYARKVNIVKFTNNEDYPNNGYYLAKELADELNSPTYAEDIGKVRERGLLQRFKDYSNAQIGNVDEYPDDERDILLDILDGAKLEKGVISPLVGTYYLGTDYGDLAEKYLRMKDVAHYGVNSEYEDSFTNSGAYPTYVGLHQQTIALSEKDNTTTGWYVKNGGLTELPESIRSRLFNIGVATGVKETAEDRAAYERTYSDGTWHEPVDASGKSIENAYVCRVNGHNYLKTGSRVKGDPIANDILHYDADTKTYYIVEIEEAVSSSKLSKTSDRNYEKTRGDKGNEVMQEIINEVAKIVGKGESYSTLATKKYLKAMDISYHDESVYDYFKTNYPELFDSDAESTSEE